MGLHKLNLKIKYATYIIFKYGKSYGTLKLLNDSTVQSDSKLDTTRSVVDKVDIVVILKQFYLLQKCPFYV